MQIESRTVHATRRKHGFEARPAACCFGNDAAQALAESCAQCACRSSCGAGQLHIKGAGRRHCEGGITLSQRTSITLKVAENRLPLKRMCVVTTSHRIFETSECLMLVTRSALCLVTRGGVCVCVLATRFYHVTMFFSCVHLQSMSLQCSHELSCSALVSSHLLCEALRLVCPATKHQHCTTSKFHRTYR